MLPLDGQLPTETSHLHRYRPERVRAPAQGSLLRSKRLCSCTASIRTGEVISDRRT